MIQAVLVCPDTDVRLQLLEKLRAVQHLHISRNFQHYPQDSELSSFLRVNDVDVAFISMEAPVHGLRVAAAIQERSAGTQIVAVNRWADEQLLLALMRGGIRHVVTVPIEDSALHEMLRHVSSVIETQPRPPVARGHLYCFLPSKGGVGASTIALNVAAARAREKNAQVLLADFDLNLGTVALMLKLNRRETVFEAAQKSHQLSDGVWANHVARVDGLTVLPAGRLDPEAWIELSQVRNLLHYALRSHREVFADLSGNMEKFSLEILRESARIFLVCSPDIPAVHTAWQKMNYLRRERLADRVSLLVNRNHPWEGVPLEDIEKTLETPIAAAFPHERELLHEALAAGRPVAQSSGFGRCCRQLARSLRALRPATTGQPA